MSGFLPNQVRTAARMNSLWMALSLDDLVENIAGQQPRRLGPEPRPIQGAQEIVPILEAVY
jgi:hypothetical protein